MKNTMFVKFLTLGFIPLFVFSGFSSNIIDSYREFNLINDGGNKENFESEKMVLISCQTYGLSDQISKKTELSFDKADELFQKIDFLAVLNAEKTDSHETKRLREEIVNFMINNNLFPDGCTVENLKFDDTSLMHGLPFNLFNKLSTNERETIGLCNFVTFGTGSQTPIIILPRLIPIVLLPLPRLLLRWSASDGLTSCGGLNSGKGFIGYGEQTGTALGFWGIGFSVFLPPIKQYGFIGYALSVSCTAESFEYYPPNNKPIISNEGPSGGSWDVSTSLSSLRFRIDDEDGDKMSYTVTTEPDIGSGNDNNVKNGMYSIPVSNLEPDTSYTWTVEVTDGKDTATKSFGFVTEIGPPFDPFEQGWKYRKKITIKHNCIQGNLENFPVLISTIDTDLLGKTQKNGEDILFMNSMEVSDRLYHEIEKFDSNTGKLIAWVKLKNISSTQDTFFYLYYGHPTISDRELPERVWDSNYQAVWHLSENGTEKRHDSTNYHRDGTPYRFEGDESIGQGKIDGADNFDGNNDYIRTGTSFDYEYRTVSFWFNTDTFPTSKPYSSIMAQDANSLTYGKFATSILPEGKMNAIAGGGDDVFQQEININQWYLLHMVRKGPINQYYIDGELKYQGISGSRGCTSDPNPNLVIAARRLYDRTFDGIIDEIRISDVARSNVWIKASYSNQNNPSNFISIGPEEVEP